MKAVDLQVNGYAGVDFNRDGLTPEDLARACRAMREAGVGGILATIITDEIDLMCDRLRRLVEGREQDTLAREMILGLHIEGPFINETPGYVGAHPQKSVRPANLEDMRCLLDACQGLARLVTLAPERDAGFAVTQFLADQGILVSAGHCDASLDELRGAIEAGLRMFTHVGNGCPMVMHRHDNIIQRALSLADQLWLCFIPDGVHIPFVPLRNYLCCTGLERVIMVSDAIGAAGLGPGTYSLGSWKEIRIGEDLVARSPDGSHFIGSTVTWPRVLANLREIGLSEQEIEQVSRHNPLASLGLTS